ncbi:hypothetical protein AK830_g2623 [Neonectria ditissima]|uniref:Uncharacterized protein n=1 Tax=Neonectria ditissima TaxID=78410 RepID=A0A0P7BUY4_9HYPO|nr:hypothetical protein AK830_g2623 [Neonectria ditissima]
MIHSASLPGQTEQPAPHRPVGSRQAREARRQGPISEGTVVHVGPPIQDEEEANGEKEQKKVKQEAALSKHHWKQLEAQLALKRQKEEKQRQDAYLEDAYRERMSMTDDDDDETWDPIEDMAQDSRDRYIDLIKHFLWMDTASAKENDTPGVGVESKTGDLAQVEKAQPTGKKGKKKAKPKAAAAKADGSNAGFVGQEKLVAMQESYGGGAAPDLQEPDKSNIETEGEMRKRLSEGVKKNNESMSGWQIVGTLENPHETYSKTAPMTKDEIDWVVNDILEIKVLLFCRLLLAQASMLPAALRATSVQEFLDDAEITESNLPDLCLKVEKPSLQEIRDACADFARGDEVGETAKVEGDDYEDEALEDLLIEDLLIEDSRYRHLHSRDWLFDTVMKSVMAKSPRKKKKSKAKSRNSKVTICGRSIWNHASEKAMSRDGWLQFSILAKDCDLKHAIQLCRNWAEFTELNHLTLWQYFPASNWVSWSSDRLIRQLQELRLFPYFTDLDAQKYSRHNQVGGRTRGRRQHDFVEARNVISAHMKRNDPVTRRFIQYLVMRTGEVLVLVRDGKTGRVITAPPEEHLWTYRKKQGLGRASKSEWENVLTIGPDYFDMTDRLREWRFGFDDYYDIFVWDFVPDQAAIGMYNVVVTELRNAWRITHPRDVYRHMQPLLQTLTREKDTMRTRQIKEGERVESLWETVNDNSTEFRLFDIKDGGVTCRSGAEMATSAYMFYNEANAAEDEVLFPDELGSNDDGHLGNKMRSIRKGLEAINKGKDPMKAQVISGIATANTEPHRPDKLDLFINYEDQYGKFPMEFGPDFMPPSKWPALLPLAQAFGGTHPSARFALLRLWSAAHYYPFMVGLFNRQNTSFLDSTGRSWEWKSVPKDMPASEFSAHRVTGARLDLLRAQFGDRVVNRGDLILVMGADSADLLKYCTAVTFALQTKPWLREIDLWKSFVNVDLDFVASLDPFWLD